MKTATIFALAILASHISFVSAQDMKIVMDIQASTYRIEIRAVTNDLEFNRANLEIPSADLCPRRVKAYLKTDAGKFVGCGEPEKGYSSAWMSSSSPIVLQKFQKIAKNSVFRSESFPISDVLQGLNHCVSKDEINLVSKIKLSFRAEIRVGGIESSNVSETDWIPMTDALRQILTR